MLIFGASGHAKVIYDCIVSQGELVKGVFDDDLNKIVFLGVEIIGKYDFNHLPEEALIISIGNNKIRELLSHQIKHKFGKIQHISSIISPSAIINEGSVIFHGAIIQSSTQIGKHCIVNTNASIDHDCTLGDFVHVAPNATICGGVSIGSGTLIGAGSVIIPILNIGKNVIIGAGSVVINDVPDNVKVFGNPAKIYGN